MSWGALLASAHSGPSKPLGCAGSSTAYADSKPAGVLAQHTQWVLSILKLATALPQFQVHEYLGEMQRLHLATALPLLTYGCMVMFASVA